jgi:hypothetical protein
MRQIRGFARSASRRARLLARLYRVDAFVSPNCGAQVDVTAFIVNPEETTRIARHSGHMADHASWRPDDDRHGTLNEFSFRAIWRWYIVLFIALLSRRKHGQGSDSK